MVEATHPPAVVDRSRYQRPIVTGRSAGRPAKKVAAASRSAPAGTERSPGTVVPCRRARMPYTRCVSSGVWDMVGTVTWHALIG